MNASGDRVEQPAAKIALLFVCTGNICRSPTAEGVMRQLVTEAGLADRFEIDSAGTHGYHAGSAPDRRAQEAAVRRGIDISKQRARRFEASDFQRYQYIITMDDSNLQFIQQLAGGSADNVRPLMGFVDDLAIDEVPDPYYGGRHGFEQVLDLLEIACRKLLAHIRQAQAL